MRLICYQPEIAGNMGAVLRIARCFGVAVDIVEPCGFVFSDTRLRRAGMDYAAEVHVDRHVDWTALKSSRVSRLVLLTTKASLSLYDFVFASDDNLILGSESAGVPTAVADECDARVRIPIMATVRSLNMAVAAGIALSEALRKTQALPGMTSE